MAEVSDDGGELEAELEAHLEENRASLQAVEEALATDAANSDLLLVREELLQAVKGVEESLLHLKRARLFREIDAMAPREAAPDLQRAEAAVESCDSVSKPDPVDVVAPLTFSVGSKCRFRHTDGRWYSGCILSMEADAIARVSFLHPSSERMQMCRFFLQQQCRFGGNCRLSHGLEIQLPALRIFNSPEWKTIPLGSGVLAEAGNGLWRPAELESWDDSQQCASIVFIADGRRLEVARDNLAVVEHADAGDVTDSSSDDEGEAPSDDELDEAPSAFGSFFGAVSGIQTETVTFAHWERHTRGMASKMMASMGFREGMGLGKAGQGITQPVKVQMLPSKQSLEFAKERQGGVAGEHGNPEKSGRKKSRGGKRKREKKWAAAQHAAKARVEGIDEARNVFDYINHQLAPQQENFSKSNKRSEDKQSTDGQSIRVKVELDNANRRTIVAHEDEIKELRMKVSKLQEMAARNRKEKAVYDAVGRKLIEARKALATAEAAHASTIHAVHSKEKERKWLRF